MNSHSAGRFRILTNGRLRSHLLPGGAGGLFQDWIALTRYSDAAPEDCGPMVYLRENGAEPDGVSVEIDAGIPPETDVEIRKITLSNATGRAREIELTTYAEIALNHPLGDAGHPAFSKLFVQTSAAGDPQVLLARRRPRGANENWPWLAQALVADGVSWETDRAKFLGRGRSPLFPAALDEAGPLSGGVGNVLDPAFAWRCRVDIPAKGSATFWLLTGAADDEKSTLSAISEVRKDPAEWLEKARAAEAARLEKLGISPADAERWDAMAATMLFGRKRDVPPSLEGADALDRHPLAWDEIRVISAAGQKADALAALPYWRELGLKIRLFVMGGAGELPEGAERVNPADFSEAEMVWWLASAQLVIGEEISAPAIPCRATRPPENRHSEPAPPTDLAHFNGFGGFDGADYVIPMPLENGELRLPPMPWCNVLASPDFGCLVTERGAGYTWSRNSQANRITPWSNDPIRDPHGEALYLRDDESGEIWSPLPGPCPPRSAFVVRHGFGNSRFESEVGGISQEVEFLVPTADPVKLVTISLKNVSAKPRRLTLAVFQQLVLAATADRHQSVLAWTDGAGHQHAVNPRAGDFAGGRVFAFLALHGAEISASGSQHSEADFLGDCGPSAPSGLAENWNGQPGFGRDACFCRKISFEIPAGGEVTLVSGIGEAMSEDEVSRIVGKYETKAAIAATRLEVCRQWESLLGGVRIETPIAELDPLVNGWLLYQNIACRIWGRSAFYQSGGAFGFRDQLQDSGALAALHPEMSREQILIHAAQQFPEGDVTHWWHPAPMGRGMRTNFADDLLWLPYLTNYYLATTGDAGVLEETLPFIEGPLLDPDEDEEYMKPEISAREATVFEHCCLAIDHSLTTGAHGLPLMGIGDWNDGMSRIGREGRGESVWMGFFLIEILDDWIPLCRTRGETERVEIYQNYRDELLAAVNAAGWDGDWYRRAYYDDGTPLGTASGDECRIDALAQAWAVISNAAPDKRAKQALDSLTRLLVDEKAGLIKLLDPPFVNTPHDPGYIKGYVAGVRENGGQYTHAACWVIRAMAEAGRRDEAADLLRRLSPLWHTRDAAATEIYKVEPYVIAADIYSVAPHVGRGGWTWYTGSAGWMFRVAIESVLGLTVENGDTLVLAPRVPDSWPGFRIDWRAPSGKSFHRIRVEIPDGHAAHVKSLTVDGKPISPENGTARWPLTHDGKDCEIVVILGR